MHPKFNYQPYNCFPFGAMPLQCFTCGQFGHKSAQCGFRFQPFPQKQLTCFKCGGFGHKKAVCPTQTKEFPAKHKPKNKKPQKISKTKVETKPKISKPKVEPKPKVEQKPAKISKPKVEQSPKKVCKAKTESNISKRLLKTSHSDYIFECKLLKMPNYTKYSDSMLKTKILAHVTQNLKHIENFPKRHQLKFLARHELIPEDQLNKLKLEDDLVSIILQALKPNQDDKKRFNSVAQKTGEKAYAGGVGRRLTYRLDNGSTGDYNIDVSNMLQSPCIVDDFKFQLSQGGPFQVKPIITFSVDWLQRETNEQYYKHLQTNYKVVHESDIAVILLEIQDEIKLMIINSQEEGSGWVYTAFDKLEFSVRDWKPGTGGSYIKLPRQIGLGFRNIVNEDEFCFKYAIGYSLRNSRLGDKTNTYLPTLARAVEKYDFSCLEFPVPCDKSAFEKFERKNLDTDLPALNVFVLHNYEKSLYPLPYYTSKVKDPYAYDAINLMFFYLLSILKMPLTSLQ